MKTLNSLLVAAAAVLALSVTFFAQAGEPPTLAQLSKNTGLLASPRYLEEHPELLRVRLPGGDSPALTTQRMATLTKNTALANSPRFREEHPQVLRVTSLAEQPQAISATDRLSRLTENKALAASPRFREEHPELLHGEPVFEIAPLK